MPIDQQPIGSLNLYRKVATPWLDEELEAAQLLADMATGYVVNVRSLDRSRTLTDQLTHALERRVVIEQAKGLIAGRHGIDVDDAFDLLRTYARQERRSLHEVCRQVLDQSVDI
ncbi:MAG: ANTAR domain-containing protein [Nitriliruptoraceae bacterium]